MSAVNLTWQDNADNETSYEVERRVDGESGFTTIATLPADSVSYSDATAPAQSSIFYRVKAINDWGASPYSETVSVITTGPLAPSLLVASAS